jgi:protein O-GlcNAc transferase
MNIKEAFEIARKHYLDNNLEEAENIYREILSIQPSNVGAYDEIGNVFQDKGQIEEAIMCYQKAIELDPTFAGSYNNLGNVFNKLGRWDEAIQNYQKAIELNPGFAGFYFNLGQAFEDKGQLDNAVANYEMDLQLNPTHIAAYHNLGTVFQKKGQLDEALLCYQKAVKLNPNFTEAYFKIGVILNHRGQFDEAIPFYQKALLLNPDLAVAYNDLGTIFSNKQQFNTAITFYQKAIELSPDIAGIHNNLGNVFKIIGQIDKAIACYQKSIVIDPEFAMSYDNLGSALKDSGRLNEAEICYRRALEINPYYPNCYSNLIFSMIYNSHYEPRTIFSEHLNFAKRYAEPLRSEIPLHTNERNLSKRLRIGYVSPDFRQHSVAYFIEPVLAYHRKEYCEIFCYADVKVPDIVTRNISEYPDHWKSIVNMSDEKVAELIYSDKIDILIDLAGHTSNNRILLFARKPAPVQVSWIGYPATTGLSTIDYKIVDHYTDPLGITDMFYTEKLIRMQESFLCYSPYKDSPDAGNLPILSTKHITFGSFNNFTKISPEVLSVWKKILHKIPNSRLIIKSKSFSDSRTRHNIMHIFTREGIHEERIELLSWEPFKINHLDKYNHVDIGLDTFPYNGTTTTCEALWMGVPVITLAGKTHASRVGVSLLSNVGLNKLIANTPEEYIDLAVSLASDIDMLQFLRKNLRDMMMRSDLTNAERFTANLENNYRTMWQHWCESI